MSPQLIVCRILSQTTSSHDRHWRTLKIHLKVIEFFILKQLSGGRRHSFHSNSKFFALGGVSSSLCRTLRVLSSVRAWRKDKFLANVCTAVSRPPKKAEETSSNIHVWRISDIFFSFLHMRSANLCFLMQNQNETTVHGRTFGTRNWRNKKGFCRRQMMMIFSVVSWYENERRNMFGNKTYVLPHLTIGRSTLA